MKILESDIQQLREKVDIVRVFEHYGVELRKRGGLYWCCCPVHQEKTPSCTVDEAKKLWYCHGCHEGGNAFDFVMKTQNLQFPEAVQAVADIMNFELTKPENADPKSEERYRKRREQIEVNKAAMLWFKTKLYSDPKALEYVRSRWNDESIEQWCIGYAPDNYHALYDHLLDLRFSTAVLDDSKLFSRSDKAKPYCLFRRRVMIPIFNPQNEPIAFSGRLFPVTDADVKDGKIEKKYINSKNDDYLYQKSEVFYGWNFAQKTIRATNNVVIVEGNPDVIHLHQIGVTNVVAACGTSLSEAQIDFISKNCHYVTLLYDNDDAGQKNMDRNGEKMLKNLRDKVTVYCATIPKDKDGHKQDPDTYFTSKEQYDQFIAAARRHWIVWYVERNKDAYRDPSQISEFVTATAEKLHWMPDTEALGYLDQLAQLIPDKTLWTAAYNTARKKEDEQSVRAKMNLSTEQEDIYQRYGLIIEHNCYFVTNGSGFSKDISNFVLKPIFLIASNINAKRVFKMINVYGQHEDIEIAQRNFTSLTAFRTATESRGNYFFWGKDEDFKKVTRYLYDHTKSCIQIDQLGWQPKPRFWAWSNGIVTLSGQFIPVDEVGTVEYNGQWYYLPALSSTTADDTEFYSYERKFVHTNSEADLLVWAEKFINTFGDNAKVALAYAIASLFRDIAFNKFRSFPLLNVFGQRGTGKTKFIMSLLRLFGANAEEGPSLESATKAAISDHMSKIYNGIVHLDEYKNNISPDIIGMLKGAYESRGRLKMDMDRDKKRMQTAVDCGLIISGQEQPTADNALFSRTIYLTFTSDKFTDEQRDTFEDLKDYERRPLTPITNQILACREIVEQYFTPCYKEVKEELRQLTLASAIEGRIFENYSIVLAYMKALDGHLALPFSYADLVKVCVKTMEKQNNAVNDTNEIADFWHGIQSMLYNRDIRLGYDLNIRRGKMHLKTYKGTGRDRHLIEWSQTYDVLYVNPTRIFDAYSRYFKATRTAGTTLLRDTTLKHYLKSQPEYMGDFSTTFTLPDSPQDSPQDNQPYCMKAWAMVFNYQSLIDAYGIDLDISPLQTEIDSATDNS